MRTLSGHGGHGIGAGAGAPFMCNTSRHSADAKEKCHMPGFAISALAS
jgi:hypothetical protein